MFDRILLVTTLLIASQGIADTSGYSPQAVFCADGSATLCPTVPSFIGPDPDLNSLGYQGLSDSVASAQVDAQSPFDNMSWQMFVALNWSARGGVDPSSALTGGGPVVWQTYDRPEDVFGGITDSCANPNDLPRFDLIAKADGKHADEGFLQATGQPVIDVNGNFALFERRLNDKEVAYIQANGLDSLAGQQAFALAGKTVQFPRGATDAMNGEVGAIELKASWRIISAAEKDRYFHMQALLDVEGEYVADGQPLCETVTVGLTGLHIIQANETFGALEDKFIWASFEHNGNAPLAANTCNPVDGNCYQQIGSNANSNNLCPAGADAAMHAFYNPACASLDTNASPVKANHQATYQWNRQVPYAGQYTSTVGKQLCGTQVTRCWDVYHLTKHLNQQWQTELKKVGSVFANYYLIGTNWGGAIEPDPGKFDNGFVPPFLGNSTLETYIQADPKFGNCAGCHAGATLAYRSPGSNGNQTTYPADFSFLLGLATGQCADLPAGPIWNDQDAGSKCPATCETAQLQWNGQWTTTAPATLSVCGCCMVDSQTSTASAALVDHQVRSAR